MPRNRHMPGHRWTTAGIAVVLLALFLAGFALYIAVGRARLTADVRIARSRDEAIRLAATANHHIAKITGLSLERVAENFRHGNHHNPLDQQDQPTWISEAYIWDGRVLASWSRVLTGRSDDPALNDVVRSALSRFINNPPSLAEKQVRYVTEHVGDQTVPLACEVFSAAGSGRPFVAAVGIDLKKLREGFLDAHFSVSRRLRVVEAGPPEEAVSNGYWQEPIAPVLEPLVIEPDPAFVAAQQRRVGVEIALYAAATGLFVIALLAMIWKFIRLVQREVALSRLRSHFVADVSHELKTPLALIRMFSEMLGEGRVSSEDKKKEYYRIITRESTRLTHMIDNILDFSRIDADKKDYTLRPVDIGPVVRETYEAYRYDLDQRGFEHKLTIANDLPQVAADADAISQAILNLISNAVKYSREDKKLVIDLAKETRRGARGVLISVGDNGIGIKPEDRNHLFDGFFRADDNRVRQARGTGLGLSLVKAIVDAHGGSIDVESRLVKGTTFRIFLPEFRAMTETAT